MLFGEIGILKSGRLGGLFTVWVGNHDSEIIPKNEQTPEKLAPLGFKPPISKHLKFKYEND
jgi:hypothetical protein